MRKRKILIFLLLMMVLLGTWTVWGNVTVGVTHYRVVSAKIPAEFQNYRIAVISDLHNAVFGENNEQLVKLIKNEKPDIIAITGDLIDASKTDIDMAELLVQQLVAIAPCYYVTGNHEAWIGEKYDDLEQRLLNAGVNVLHDESLQITKNSEIIQLAGLDDPDFTDRDHSIQESMIKTKLSGLKLNKEMFSVLLSHRPEVFPAYVSENIDLVLSGHAHGGQFRLPFVGGLVAPNQGLFPKYDAGLFKENGTTMIVSRGIGNSIIPIRFNNRPEIVIVELVCDR